MSYLLMQNLTTVNFTKGKNRTIKYIVIHYTGNTTDTAKNNANYFKSVNRGASAHYFVDDSTVYQCVKDEDVAWAVGRNYGTNNLFGTVTNQNSISIEMCSTNGKISNKTFDNTVALTKSLMNKYKISINNVYRHFDVCSKRCPGWSGWGTGTGDGSIWLAFKAALKGTSNMVQPVQKPNILYKVYVKSRWLPEVVNNSDYAGIENQPIYGFMCRLSNGLQVKYRCHVIGKGWYGWVTGHNPSDVSNGFAGDLKNQIDAIEIKCDRYDIRYKVSSLNNGANYYAEVKDSDNDYAGVFNRPIDKVMCRIV